jgi:4-hydroxybenzoate polyprenyltransferase
VFLPLVSTTHRIFSSMMAGIPFMISAMLGFCLNDIHDQNKDSICKPWRALPSGLVTYREAEGLLYLLLFFNISSILAISSTFMQFCLYFAALFGVLLYNKVVKSLAVYKVFITALICALPIIYVSLEIKEMFMTIFVASIAFIYISGRELRMDILDLPGDISENIKTIPILIGVKSTSKIAGSLILISLILTMMYVLSSGSNIYHSILIVAFLLAAQGICEFEWKSQRIKQKRLSILLQWIPMLLGCFSCLFIS